MQNKSSGKNKVAPVKSRAKWETWDRGANALENVASVVGTAAGMAGLFIGVSALPVVAFLAGGVMLGVSVYRTATGYYDSKAEAALNIGLGFAGLGLGAAAKGAKPITQGVKGLRSAIKQGMNLLSANWSAATVPLSFSDDLSGW